MPPRPGIIVYVCEECGQERELEAGITKFYCHAKLMVLAKDPGEQNPEDIPLTQKG